MFSPSNVALSNAATTRRGFSILFCATVLFHQSPFMVLYMMPSPTSTTMP